MNADGHLTHEEAAAFVASGAEPRVLSATERLAISDHVAGCSACRSRLLAASPRRAGNEAAVSDEEYQLALGEPPTSEELLASVSTDPTLADLAARALLETRLSLHPQVRGELDDLRAFRSELEKFPAEDFAPGGTGFPAVRSAAGRERVGWTARFRLWLPMAAAASAMLVAVLGWWLLASVLPGGLGPAAPVAQLNDGPVQVSASGEVRSALALPADLRDAILETVRRRALPGVGLDGAFRGGEAAAPPLSDQPGSGFAALGPIGAVVESTRPTLRWRPHPDAQRYEVTLNFSGGDLGSLQRTTLPATATEWTPAEPLTRGRFYRWQVLAFGSGDRELARTPTSPDGALVKVLSAPAHETLEHLRHAFADSHLVLGVAYAREGMRDEAAAEFRALQSAHPDSVLARDLAAGSGQP